jgi:hypothetical protein
VPGRRLSGGEEKAAATPWVVCGRLTLADLAGSERATDRSPPHGEAPSEKVAHSVQADKLRLAEAIAINKASDLRCDSLHVTGGVCFCRHLCNVITCLMRCEPLSWQSLSALRECMRASDAFRHGKVGGSSTEARYRQNALTLLLRDAFVFK